ncbi:MAG: glycosyltransferase family 2 protein [Bacteroidetes bacterium]|nr:glycosyltransferase family 2 protein [Bacteroidota bacterium]
MIQLSVVIITYNEEKNIERCLMSVRDVADEIVVVDSFSTDRTIDICKRFGARVIQHVFEGHIQQKNFALEQATYHHVLSLDADEVLSDELQKEIQRVKKQWNYDCYEMNRLTNYCGTWIYHCGWYPDRKIRLFDKRKGRWTGINPHDRFELFDYSATKGRLKGDILHYSYSTISDHIRQFDYFTEISARVLYEQQKKATLIKIIVAPILRFVRDYILKAGFLDGYYGLVICLNSSYSVFVKYCKLRELSKTNRMKGGSYGQQ